MVRNLCYIYGLYKPMCIKLIPYVSPFVSCPLGSLFKPGGEVCRHWQGAYNETHAANGRTNGHVQPHGHPVWSIWRLCTGSKYRHWLYVCSQEQEKHLELHRNTHRAEEKESRGGTRDLSAKLLTWQNQAKLCYPGQKRASPRQVSEEQ